MRKNEKIALLSLIAVALALRLFAIYMTGASLIKFGDAADYLSASKSLCSSGSYPDRSSLPFFRPPGLPLFIAGATLCHPDQIWRIKAALATVDTISVVIIFLLAEQLFHKRPVSFIAGAAATIYPFFIVQVCDVQTEALFMFFLVAAIWLALKAMQEPSFRLMLLAGAVSAAAALVRPVGLLLLPVLLASPAYLRSAKEKDYARLAGAFAIGAVFCLCPWIIRNELRYHEFILIDDAGGYNVWRGTSAEMDRIEKLRGRHAFEKASVEFETVTSPEIAREIDKVANTPSTRSREWYRRALKNLAEDPIAVSIRLLRNALAYWRPWLNPQTYPPAVVAVSGVMTISLDVLALFGWLMLRKQNRRLALFCAGAATLFWVAQIPFQVVSRFRIPITDPFLIAFASASLGTFITKRLSYLSTVVPLTLFH